MIKNLDLLYQRLINIKNTDDEENDTDDEDEEEALQE